MHAEGDMGAVGLPLQSQDLLDSPRAKSAGPK